MARFNLEDGLWVFGIVKNAVSKLLELPMTSTYSADILIKIDGNPKAIFEAIRVDNKFYPESQTNTKISLKNNNLHIQIDSKELPHMRANVNSILRLVQASYDSIKTLEL